MQINCKYYDNKVRRLTVPMLFVIGTYLQIIMNNTFDYFNTAIGQSKTCVQQICTLEGWLEVNVRIKRQPLSICIYVFVEMTMHTSAEEDSGHVNSTALSACGGFLPHTSSNDDKGYFPLRPPDTKSAATFFSDHSTCKR